MIEIGFHGAAGTVTGSRHLISTGRSNVLVDCGQFQGLKEHRERNWKPPPFEPSSVDAVLLTHAHIDHSGMLPRLQKLGFRGPIYTTPATAELVEILLLDAARLQEEDAAYANRKGFSKHRPALPLFTEEDAEQALRRLRTVDYGVGVDLPGMEARFHNAGHILGSAHVEVQLGEDSHTIVFSGDLGRYDVPLHRDPDPLPRCDTLIVESTYGDREHDHDPLPAQLTAAVTETLANGGTVLIPSFAVARAQLITLLLGRLIAAGQIPRVPVHVDSPMAVDVTDIYRRFANHANLDDDITAMPGGSLFPATAQFHRSVQESRALNNLRGPRVIISSSGMLAGGRVLHHLRRLAPDPRNLILLAGYQAIGTRGRRLLDGARTLRVHGGDVEVHAKVKSVEGFSAHADSSELVRWVGSGATRPKSVFLVHGEPESASALKATLEPHVEQVIIPAIHERFMVAAAGGWTQSDGSRETISR